MKRRTPLADIGVDLFMDPALDSDREPHRDATVDRLCDQVSGIVFRSLHGNAAVGRLRDQAGSAPLIPVKPYAQAAVHSRGMHVSGEIVEGEAAVGRICMN